MKEKEYSPICHNLGSDISRYNSTVRSRLSDILSSASKDVSEADMFGLQRRLIEGESSLGSNIRAASAEHPLAIYNLGTPSSSLSVTNGKKSIVLSPLVYDAGSECFKRVRVTKIDVAGDNSFTLSRQYSGGSESLCNLKPVTVVLTHHIFSIDNTAFIPGVVGEGISQTPPEVFTALLALEKQEVYFTIIQSCVSGRILERIDGCLVSLAGQGKVVEAYDYNKACYHAPMDPNDYLQTCVTPGIFSDELHEAQVCAGLKLPCGYVAHCGYTVFLTD